MKNGWLDIVAYTSNYSLGFTARPCLENKTKKLKISNQNNKTKTKCAHTPQKKQNKNPKDKASKQTKNPTKQKRASSLYKILKDPT